MTINAETCTECSDVKTGKLDDFYDSDTLGRINYFCNNAENYPKIGSTVTSQNFFSIGRQIPIGLNTQVDIVTSESFDPTNFDGNGGRKDINLRSADEDVTDSIVGRYIVYLFAFLVIILIIVFAIWHTQRKRHMMAVRNRIL